jgi:glycosyltransferase involved in cell wall biosynthesis
MHILVLADNFVPEIAATSFRVRDHAKVWLADGHEVTVVTCVPNWPHGKAFPGYKNRLYQVEWLDGIRVIRLWSYMTANKGFLRRTLDYVSFMVSAILFCWRYPKFDVILATSPQFFTAVAGWAISILRWRPWVFEIRDLWPASIKAVGAGDGWMIRALERLELFLYRHANRIIALTNAFRRDLTVRGIAGEKIEVVTNGVDVAQFNRGTVTYDARQRLGIPADKFLAGYIGTTGMAHGLETILDAADLCGSAINNQQSAISNQQRPGSDIHFLIMGEGAERERLEADARTRGLTNLQFADRVPQEEVPNYLAALDLAIIHLRPDPVFKTVIPSKLFEFMAMGVPVLMAVEVEAAEIVADSGCGVCIPSGNSRDLADEVIRLSANCDQLSQMSRRGQTAAAEQFGRNVKARQALLALQTAAGSASLREQEPRRLEPSPDRTSRRKAA